MTTAGASVVTDTGNPVTFEYLSETPSSISAVVVVANDLKQFDCLPEFEARFESGAEHFYALGTDVPWKEFTNRHYNNLCTEAVTTARLEPEPPSGTMSSYLVLFGHGGCHWSVRGAPNEDAGRYTLIVDEISLAYPNDSNGNPIPLKTGVSTQLSLCTSDAVHEHGGPSY